ncbi:MAG: 30S ribosomal protein S17 [Candidatus Pacearchaeota archaeon]|nr:30S ribosomal protein S17 [Candidatus Pacearchaeota archaeon]
MTKKNEQKEVELKMIDGTPILTHGRVFEGKVVKKFPSRVVIEFERTVYVPKYERFYKKKTRLHARLPSNIDVAIGDLIKVAECRPISKLVHFIVIGKVIKGAEK